MPTEPEHQDDWEIVEKVNYLTAVLIPSIRAIDNAIENDKSTKYLPRSLLTNIPKMWRDELQDKIKAEKEKLDTFISNQDKHFVVGVPQSEKDRANEIINDARIKYAQDIKEIIINLLQEKVGLFQTRKKVETGAIDLYEVMGITPEKEDNDR